MKSALFLTFFLLAGFCQAQTVFVLQGYNSTATSVSLTNGSGSLLPEYLNYLIWWDYTDYSASVSDPNYEVVRETAISGDTLTVARGAQGTSAVAHQLPGKTYAMEVIGLFTPTHTPANTNTHSFTPIPANTPTSTNTPIPGGATTVIVSSILFPPPLATAIPVQTVWVANQTPQTIPTWELVSFGTPTYTPTPGGPTPTPISFSVSNLTPQIIPTTYIVSGTVGLSSGTTVNIGFTPIPQIVPTFQYVILPTATNTFTNTYTSTPTPTGSATPTPTQTPLYGANINGAIAVYPTGTWPTGSSSSSSGVTYLNASYTNSASVSVAFTAGYTSLVSGTGGKSIYVYYMDLIQNAGSAVLYFEDSGNNALSSASLAGGSGNFVAPPGGYAFFPTASGDGFGINCSTACTLSMYYEYLKQ